MPEALIVDLGIGCAGIVILDSIAACSELLAIGLL
jgi:hypothetical protein